LTDTANFWHNLNTQLQISKNVFNVLILHSLNVSKMMGL